MIKGEVGAAATVVGGALIMEVPAITEDMDMEDMDTAAMEAALLLVLYLEAYLEVYASVEFVS